MSEGTGAIGPQTHSLYLEDYEVGLRIRTMGRTIAEADLVNFVGVTGLYEEMFHNTRLAAVEGRGAGRRLVPGQLVMSFAEGLFVLTGALHGTGIALLRSEIDFSSATYVGDTIHVDVEVLETRRTSKGDRGIVKTRNTITNQDGDPVAQLVVTRMIRARDPAEPQGSGR